MNFLSSRSLSAELINKARPTAAGAAGAHDGFFKD